LLAFAAERIILVRALANMNIPVKVYTPLKQVIIYCIILVIVFIITMYLNLY
jgi:hypothetical protein